MSLYRSMVEQVPDHPKTIRAYSWLAKRDVMKGDFESADIKCQKIFSDFHSDPELDNIINRVAQEYYRKSADPAQAQAA